MSQSISTNGKMNHRKYIFVYILAWYPVALLALYLKQTILNQSGYIVVSRSIGMVDKNLPLVDKLSFFAFDLVYLLIIIPCVLLVGLYFLKKKYRPTITSVAAILFALLFYWNMQSIGTVGRYLSYEMLVDSVSWTFANPEYFSKYVEPSSLAKLLVVLLIVISIAFFAYAIDKRQSFKVIPVIAYYMQVAVIAGSLLVAVYSSSASTLSDTKYHENIATTTISSFFILDGAISGEYRGLSKQQLITKYKELVNSQYKPDSTSAFSAKGKDFDLLFFVFETGPYKSLDLKSNLEDFPNLSRLMSQAVIGYKHFSTYPYTNQALFSIFSSNYPPISSLSKVFNVDSDTAFPGIMHILADKGYQTTVYNPFYAIFEEDDKMFKSIGFDQLVYAEEDKTNATDKEGWERILHYDLATLTSLKKDVTQWIDHGQRYALAYLPQVGHAPWHNLTNTDDVIARGRAIMALQDKWLGELVQLLKAKGKLDKTIVVVTADHGIRTRQEDPSFVGGMIDAYSFHVPMVIAAPGIFQTPIKIEHVTSHVDIAPSIADLLGVVSGESYFMGEPMWSETLEQRTTFFFAGGYLGADGFYHNDTYHMKNYVSGMIYQNQELGFNSDNIIAANQANGDLINTMLGKINSIRNYWFELYTKE